MLPAPLPAGGMSVHHALDLVEQLAGDEQRVGSLALHTFPTDDAGVHRVPEHPVDRADARWVPQAVPQAPVGQSLGQRGEGQVARGVALEGPHDERGLLIGLEHRLAATPGPVSSDVPVSERGADRPAALRRLLVHALADFLAEVGRVELGDRGEDALHELAGGRVLQGFGDRVQLHACLPKRGANCCVVLEVPGQPIELVDHKAVDAGVLGQTCQHRLELRPDGGPGRLAPIDVLVGELPAAIGDEPAAGLGLGWDRVTLLGLLSCRDPEVGDGLHGASSRLSCSASARSALARGLRLASSSDPTRSSLTSSGSSCSRSSCGPSPLPRRRGRASIGAFPRRGLKGHVGAAGR
jgi:hypothetical protein